MAEHAQHAHGGQGEAEHASVKTYTIILAVLAVVTLLEVATYFIPWFQAHRSVLFWTLSVMSIAKFTLVVGYYMHLRFDAVYYTRVFVVPLVIAIIMTVIVAVLTGIRYIPG